MTQILTVHSGPAFLVQINVLVNKVADKLGSFEPLLADTRLSVKLPYFCALVEDKDVSFGET